MISKLRHRLILCTQKDVVGVGGDLTLNRKGLLSVWAKIDNKRKTSFVPGGLSNEMNRTVRTHTISIRYRRELDVTIFAWLYEERRKSAPRWFKITKVNQSEDKGSEYFMFDCILLESGPNAQEPELGDDTENGIMSAMPLPEGINL